MATFTNQASLSYNGIVTTSNIATGEIVEILSITKNSLSETYQTGDTVTYVVSLSNSDTAALSGITLDDTLGEYTFGTTNLMPLEYVDGSLRYYLNGVLQATPTIVTTSPLSITGITVPAGGNALLVYEANVTNYAPLGIDGSIENIATASRGGIATPTSATEIITKAPDPTLSINKSVSPTSVVENGTLTYTFVIQNSGNTEADASANAIITDTFNPILQNITVTFNGTTWAPTTNYTYNATTGEFATVAGQITVPAATYSQNATTGEWEITPGVSTLTVTGTI